MVVHSVSTKRIIYTYRTAIAIWSRYPSRIYKPTKHKRRAGFFDKSMDTVLRMEIERS